MTNIKKNSSWQEVEEQRLQDKVEVLISKTSKNNILNIYWEYKPRYIPSFVYSICLRRFILMEYHNIWSITKLLEAWKKIINNEKKEALSKQAKTIWYSLVKSER